MTEIVDPGSVAQVGYPCPPQETPEVFVDIAQRHRPLRGCREKEGVVRWEGFPLLDGYELTEKVVAGILEKAR